MDEVLRLSSVRSSVPPAVKAKLNLFLLLVMRGKPMETDYASLSLKIACHLTLPG